MGLRSPIFLDSETLLALAEYHGVDWPRPETIVEKSVRNKEAGASVGYRAVSAHGSIADNVEFQSTYALEPKEKATTSKVIDGLFKSDVVRVPSGSNQLWQDDLVEVEGKVSITTASMVGKMFYLVRTLLEADGVDINGLEDLHLDSPGVQAKIKDLYLRNELPPVPILVKVTGPSTDEAIYASLNPGCFVGDAALDRLEGTHRILGTVQHIVEAGSDGYLATDPWLLSGWEYLMRRLLMAQLGDQVKEMAAALDIDLPDDDAHGWIEGPAVVLDAVAIY